MFIRHNAPDVIHESFDNESVIVNLRVGVYFSLNEAGLPLWEMIGNGITETALCELWREKQGGTESDAQAVVRAFLCELQQEQLVIVDSVESLTPPEGPLPESLPRPALQKFTDLQDLLMLDPVHDVDERGWPHAKPDDCATTGA